MSNVESLRKESETELREALAEYAHQAWAGWMQYLFSKTDGTGVIPLALVARWQEQMSTNYADLPENEKESDRTEADRMIAIMEEKGCQIMCSTRGSNHAHSR